MLDTGVVEHPRNGTCLVRKRRAHQTAIQALRIQLDLGNRVLAAQDFRQAVQKDGKSVADYVRRLERYFQ